MSNEVFKNRTEYFRVYENFNDDDEIPELLQTIKFSKISADLTDKLPRNNYEIQNRTKSVDQIKKLALSQRSLKSGSKPQTKHSSFKKPLAERTEE